MNRDDVVVLRKYADEISARVAALSLEANGIPAQVSADTAGGALPSLAIGFPVRLLVRATAPTFTFLPPPPGEVKPFR